MHARVGGLRLLASCMAIVWLATVVALLLGYRPGGPLDGMVALGPALATAVAVAAAAWPPIFRGRRAWQAVAWLGIGTLLVLLPTAADLISRLAAEGPAPLLPSPSSAYAWLVSLVGTALFSGLGVSRRMLAPDADRRRGVALGIGIAAVTVGLAGSLSGAAVAANDDALRRAEPGVSDWGPTDASHMPPACDGPLATVDGAIVEETATASSAGRTIGTAFLSGTRDGGDSRWTLTFDVPLPGGSAAVATDRLDYRRSGSAGWASKDGGAWQMAPLDDVIQPGPANPGSGPVESPLPGAIPFVAPNTLDQSVIVAALPRRLRAASGDLGIEVIGGARARHCTLAVDGPTALAAFRPLRALVGQDVLSNDPALGDWRGELDWWVFGDGQLGRATVTAGGLSPAAWTGASSTGSLTATLTARHRGTTVVVPTAAP